MNKITPELLLNAYANGYFPMAQSKDAKELHWFHPEMRGVIPLEDFHIPKSLAKFARKAPYHITMNHDFEGVIRSCANREDTWINAEIIALYCELHRMGFAHSVEVYKMLPGVPADVPPTAAGKNKLRITCAGMERSRRRDGLLTANPTPTPQNPSSNLIGGLYGVALGGAFFGESMFSRAPNASKLALLHLVETLKNSGYTLLDAQYVNEHLQQFGIREIPKEEYMKQLEAALSLAPILFAPEVR